MQMTGTWPRDRHDTRKLIMNAADSARVRNDFHFDGCCVCVGEGWWGWRGSV
jgi:hypothetical protein